MSDLQDAFEQPQDLAEESPLPSEEQYPPSAVPEGQETTEPAADPVPQDDFIELDSVTRVSREEAEALGRFYRELEANPQRVAAAMAEAFLSQQQQQAPQYQPADEYEDPGLRAIHERMARLEYDQTQRTMEQSRGYVNVALQNFAERHHLEPNEVNAVAGEAARLGILQNLQAPDPISAVDDALERTYWAIPQLREREFAQRANGYQQDRRRQRRLAGISGTSGSVPRQNRPTTPEDRRAAMVADLAAAMGQTQET